MGYMLKNKKVGGGFIPGRNTPVVDSREEEVEGGTEVAGGQEPALEEAGDPPEDLASLQHAAIPARAPALLRGNGATEGRTVKLSFPLSNPLHTRLKLESVRRRQSIGRMIAQWVDEKTPEE